MRIKKFWSKQIDRFLADISCQKSEKNLYGWKSESWQYQVPGILYASA